MEASELLKKVRAIEIKTRGLSSHIFSGEYHSAFKGRGMAFSEVREYVPGDEIRNIDWNVTARMGHPFVKVFEEERELTVIILADVSASGDFGTRKQLKRSLITELTATLAFSAIQNHDKIGVIFFSDRIEKFIPPKKGKSHILRIVRELLQFKPEGKGTNIKSALEYLNNVQKKHCICFVISDFLDENFENALRITSKRHDVVALRVYDQHEKIFPAIGLIKIEDNETGKSLWVNTSGKALRSRFMKNIQQRDEQLKSIFSKSGVDVAQIATDEDYVKPLMNLFKRRAR
ncbi:MAG: DUF58 domain-containing protein [Flavobacteriales bacterium]|nr:DUF58 domain-containing protein [Flavobacteriales bacterium]